MTTKNTSSKAPLISKAVLKSEKENSNHIIQEKPIIPHEQERISVYRVESLKSLNPKMMHSQLDKSNIQSNKSMLRYAPCNYEDSILSPETIKKQSQRKKNEVMVLNQDLH